MRPFLRIEIVTVAERHQALTATADALGAAGGWIVDHTLFSDVMAVIRFSLPVDRVGEFARLLIQAGLIPDPPLAAPPPGAPTGADAEIAGQLTLTFSGGSGDLRRAVPAFA